MSENTERTWFLRIATVLMLACIAVGAVPVIKNTLYPTSTRR